MRNRRALRHRTHHWVYFRRKSALEGLFQDLTELFACLIECTLMTLTIYFIAMIFGFQPGLYEVVGTLTLSFLAWVIYKD